MEQHEGNGHWPPAYRSVVQLADWRSCSAARVADARDSDPNATPVLMALRDLSRSLCFDPRGPIALRSSLPAAVERVSLELKQP